MPSVIADTSPLQYLHQIGCLGLLADLFQRVIVPDGVAQEILRGPRKEWTFPTCVNCPGSRSKQPPRRRTAASLVGEIPWRTPSSADTCGHRVTCFGLRAPNETVDQRGILRGAITGPSPTASNAVEASLGG
jgi:hypothetical protein